LFEIFYQMKSVKIHFNKININVNEKRLSHKPLNGSLFSASFSNPVGFLQLLKRNIAYRMKEKCSRTDPYP
jgi:hypothetical protein